MRIYPVLILFLFKFSETVLLLVTAKLFFCISLPISKTIATSIPEASGQNVKKK